MKRLFLIIFLTTAFLSCKNEKKKGGASIDSPNKIRIAHSNEDTLHIEYSDGSKDKLIVGSSEFEYLLSPDSQKVAINTRVFSDLTITEVFGLEENGRIHPNERINISEIVWDSIEQLHKIPKEDVLFPKTYAVKWNQDGSALRVSVTGSSEIRGFIEEEFEIKIKD